MTKPLSDAQIRGLLREYYNNPEPVVSPAPAPRVHLRRLTRIAAAIVLFAVGVALGGQRARSGAAAPGLALTDRQPVGLEIQRTGSEYIRALAALNVRDGTPPALRDEARQIAVETLIGATREMIDLLQGETQVVRLFTQASALRERDPEQSNPAAYPVRF